MVVVGLGSIGLHHARLSRRHAGHAVDRCEASPESRALAVGVLGSVSHINDRFTSAGESKPDTMGAAIPHSAHANQGIAAMEAGIYVFCERPLSDSLEGGKPSLKRRAAQLR
jgi:predicted dehydrogenase